MNDRLTIFDIADGKQEPLPVSPQFDWEGKRIIEDQEPPPEFLAMLKDMVKDMIKESAPSILTESTNGKQTTGVLYPPGYKEEAEKIRAHVEQQLNTNGYVKCTNDHCANKIKSEISSKVSSIIHMNEILCFCNDDCLDIWWRKLTEFAASLFIKNGFVKSKKNSRILGDCLTECIDLHSAYEIAHSFHKIKGVTKTKAFAEAILIAKVAAAQKMPPFIYLRYFIEGIDNITIPTERDEEETAIYLYRMKQVFANLQEKGLIS